MQLSNVYEWIKKQENRRKILLSLKQPLTAKQISIKTGIDIDTCSYVLGKFTVKRLNACLNPKANSSRLYWVTELGQKCRNRLCQELNLSKETQIDDLAGVNWQLYGWVCFNHRAAIIRILTEPMQPSEIKRRLRILNPDIKISANNIRDIMRLFLKKGIVRKIFVKKKVHPRYELTKLGGKLQRLLSQAQAP